MGDARFSRWLWRGAFLTASVVVILGCKPRTSSQLADTDAKDPCLAVAQELKAAKIKFASLSDNVYDDLWCDAQGGLVTTEGCECTNGSAVLRSTSQSCQTTTTTNTGEGAWCTSQQGEFNTEGCICPDGTQLYEEGECPVNATTTGDEEGAWCKSQGGEFNTEGCICPNGTQLYEKGECPSDVGSNSVKDPNAGTVFEEAWCQGQDGVVTTGGCECLNASGRILTTREQSCVDTASDEKWCANQGGLATTEGCECENGKVLYNPNETCRSGFSLSAPAALPAAPGNQNPIVSLSTGFGLQGGAEEAGQIVAELEKKLSICRKAQTANSQSNASKGACRVVNDQQQDCIEGHTKQSCDDWAASKMPQGAWTGQHTPGKNCAGDAGGESPSGACVGTKDQTKACVGDNVFSEGACRTSASYKGFADPQFFQGKKCADVLNADEATTTGTCNLKRKSDGKVFCLQKVEQECFRLRDKNAVKFSFDGFTQGAQCESEFTGQSNQQKAADQTAESTAPAACVCGYFRGVCVVWKNFDGQNRSVAGSDASCNKELCNQLATKTATAGNPRYGSGRYDPVTACQGKAQCYNNNASCYYDGEGAD